MHRALNLCSETSDQIAIRTCYQQYKTFKESGARRRNKTQWWHSMAEKQFYNQQLTQPTSHTDASLMPTITTQGRLPNF